MTEDADLRTSFPFSRFVADQDFFQIDFAVKKAESYQEVN